MNRRKVIGLSLITVMLLSVNTYAGKIIGVDASEPYVKSDPQQQFGWGGWNLDESNVTVYITDVGYGNGDPTIFDISTGMYDSTSLVNKSFESSIATEGIVRAKLHGKDWPVGEPSGIKVINNDTAVQHGKPFNCIMNTSFLAGNYLDSATPKPVICSSDFQTHKRFKVNMLESTVSGISPGEYGKPIDLIFNLDTDTETVRYQVLQKINNYTGVRLDGFKIEVIGDTSPAPTISLGIGEGDSNSNIWTDDELANFSHGLWGPVDEPHFSIAGFFDDVRAGFQVTGHGTNIIVGGPTTLGSNYSSLFGVWLPSAWQPKGIFWDHDNDPATDAELVAFWGTVPDAPIGTEPAWHKGKTDNWVEPTSQELLQWETDPLYEQDGVEDALNLGLNYIVNLGAKGASDTFTIRITPHIASDQTPPSYIDGSGSPILPPELPPITDGTVAISPAPTFVIGNTLILSVKDEDQNINPTTKDTITVTVTSDTGDKETVILTETDINTAIFTSTIASELTTTSPVIDDGKMNVIKDCVVTVTYEDNTHDTFASTTATILTENEDDAVDSSANPASSGGGGCTSNPNAKSFDMMFLVMIALGLLFPFRRKFIK